MRLPGIPRLCIAATTSSRVKSSRLATRANDQFAYFSNGDVLPPLDFALALPVLRQRWSHLTAELALSLKFSAASRRDAPASTASITRSRKSSEYGFGIDLAPQKYTPDPGLRERRSKMYGLRSKILHGSDLMQLDQGRAFGWDPPWWNEREMNTELWSLMRIAARNWLRGWLDGEALISVPAPNNKITVSRP